MTTSKIECTIPWTDTHTAVLLARYHTSESCARGPPFVPITAKNRNRHKNMRFNDETRLKRNEQNEKLRPLLYRVVRIDDKKGHILLQSTFLDVLAFLQRLDLEYISLDSRCSIFCGNQMEERTANFHDVQINDLIWIYGMIIAGTEDPDADLRISESAGILQVVKKVQWAAISGCFASRKYFWDSRVVKDYVASSEEVTTKEELAWLVMNEKDEERQSSSKSISSNIDALSKLCCLKIDAKKTIHPAREGEDQKKIVAPTLIEDNNKKEERGPSEHSRPTILSKPADCFAQMKNPPKRPASNDVQGTIVQMPSSSASTVSISHQTPSSTTSVSGRNKKSKVMTNQKGSITPASSKGDKVISSEMKRTLMKLRKKIALESECLLNQDIFKHDEGEFDGETMSHEKKIELIAMLKEAPTNHFNACCESILLKRWQRVECDLPQRHEQDTTINYPCPVEDLIQEGFPCPLPYRVIAVLGERKQLLLECLLLNKFWLVNERPGTVCVTGDYYRRQFIILDDEGCEGPHLNRRGFNIYDCAVNDIICIYDFLPYTDAQPEDSCYERSMYKSDDRMKRNVWFKSNAHSFVNLPIFKTFYGMVSNGRTTITGIDEVITTEALNGVQKSIAEPLENGDLFRIDVMQAEIFDQIGDLGALRAGGLLPYVTELGPRNMLIVSGKKLTAASYEAPFSDEFQFHELEALDRQTAMFTLGIYADLMKGRIENLEKARAVSSQFEVHETFTGALGNVLPKRFQNQHFLKVIVRAVGSFGIQLHEDGNFSVMEASKKFFTANLEKIMPAKGRKELFITNLDCSPNANPAVRFLCNGAFARSMKRQECQKEEKYPSQLLFNLLSDRECPETYGYARNQPAEHVDPALVFDKKTLQLGKQQREFVNFISGQKMENWPKIVIADAVAGTGKTVCSAAVLLQSSKDYPYSKQLTCSLSDQAVDRLAEVLFDLEEGPRFIRIFSDSQLAKLNFKEPNYGFNAVVEVMSRDPSGLDLTEEEAFLLAQYRVTYKRLADHSLNPQSREDFECIHKMKKKMKAMLPTVSSIVMRTYRPHVILTTVDVFLNDSLNIDGNTLCQMEFDRVLVEESTQLSHAKLSLLANRNIPAKQIILVSDQSHMPTVYSPFYHEHLYDLVPYWTTQRFGISHLRAPLISNYRMLPALADAVRSTRFSKTAGKRFSSKDGPWKDKAIKWKYFNEKKTFILRWINGKSHRTPQSLTNEKEADGALCMVEAAIDNGAKEDEIGVVCFYEAQRSRVADHLKSHGITEVDVGTVDSFLGREKDYIIVLTTRDTYEEDGIINDSYAINVATSRSILGTVILANPSTMQAGSPDWTNIVEYCQNHAMANDTESAPFRSVGAEWPARQLQLMDKDMRIRAFMEEYSRMIQLLDDINAMKESMFRIEMLMMIMVILLAGTIGLSALVFICKAFCCNIGTQDDRPVYYSDPPVVNHQRATFSLEKGVSKSSPVKSTSCDLPRGSVT